MVKSKCDFSPGKKFRDDITFHQAAMIALGFLLVRYALRRGPMSDDRFGLMETIQDRFCAYVMFVNADREDTASSLFGVIEDYMSHEEAFDRHISEFLMLCQTKFSQKLKWQIITHLAMFERLDPLPSDEVSRRGAIRDEWGALSGTVGDTDIDKILNEAAGYSFDHR